MTFLPYGRQYIDDEDIEAVTRVLRSDFLTTGPEVERFENALADYTGAPHAIVCGNGTQALHLALLGIDLKPDDYVIVPTLTFLATANATRYCGANIIFADVEPNSGLLTPEIFEDTLNNHIDKNIRAVLPVHLGGNMADLSGLKAIADKHNIKVIADSCHALGATYGDVSAGACLHEDFSTFSFHPVKAIAMGEGGAVTTRDSDLADKMRTLRSHGITRTPEKGMWSYDMNVLGYNYRANDIQCALGYSQLSKLPKFIERRRQLAALYNEALQPLAPVIRPPVNITACHSAYHLYAVRIDFGALEISRSELMVSLREKNIGTQVHYIPVHTQPYYQNLYGTHSLPGAEHYYEGTLSLPLYYGMEDSDVGRVVKALSDIIFGRA